MLTTTDATGMSVHKDLLCSSRLNNAVTIAAEVAIAV